MTDTSFLESYVLATDKSVPLGKLVQGTEDYYYYNIIHLLATDKNGNNASQIEKLLQAYEKACGNNNYRVKELKTRVEYYLGSRKDWGKLCDRIISDLQIKYNHHRTVIGTSDPTQPARPSEADQSQLTWKHLFSQIRTISEVHYNNWVAAERVFKAANSWRPNVANCLPTPDVPNLVEYIAETLSNKQPHVRFGQHPIHHKLTLKQLDDLRSLKTDIINDENYVQAYLQRLAPSDDVDIQFDAAEREEYFKRLKKFVWKLSPAFNRYRVVLLYYLLKHNLEQGKYDNDLFMEYIKIGKNSTYINATFYSKASSMEGFVDIYSLPHVFGFQSPGYEDDDTLVRQYLLYFLRTGSWKQYAEWISKEYLESVDAEAKLLYGEGDPEKYASVLGASRCAELKNEVEITLLPNNPKYFHPSDDVKIAVELKNVPILHVKVFEINTARYYKDNMKEIPTDIQLDGLVANEEKTYKFDHHPMRRFTQIFEFPALKRRGVFVIEFIGNGKSSRCVIRKGKLSFVERVGAAGHIFTILDENFKPLSKASLWLAGHQFETGSDGTIVVPFTKSPGLQSIILANEDGFCSLDQFQHLAENYSFDARFFIDREAILTRNKASVLIRLNLTIHNAPVSVTLLEEPVFTIKTTDIDGIDASKEIRNLKFSDDEETSVEFNVPDKLQSISFTFTAKIKAASTGAWQTFTKSQTFSVNGIDKDAAFSTWFFRRTPSGYELLLLGKTGEPIKDKLVTVYFKNRYFSREQHQLLQTNSAGVISLGLLEEIDYVYVSDMAKKWYLSRDSHNLPSVINAKEGDVIQIPFMDYKAKITPEDVALIETRQGVNVADHFSAMTLKNGLIYIKGLAPGNYDLYLKELNKKISIAVTKGTSYNEWIYGQRRMLQEQELAPLQITSVSQSKETVDIQLVNHSESTRVHVIATEFVPDFDVKGILNNNMTDVARVTFSRLVSNYLNGRQLSEEYRYILERKYQSVYPGNTLTRPSLILQPWAIQSTSTDKKDAKEGDSYEKEAAGYARSQNKLAAAAPAPTSVSNNSYANMDFKRQASVFLINLRPNKDGIVSIERSKLKPNSVLRVVALDGISEVFREVTLDKAKLQFKDLRLRIDKAFNPKSYFTEQKHITEVYAGDKFVSQDISTSKVEIFDNLSKVASLLSTLSNGNATFQEFNFVLKWDQLSENEKREKFSKYACHELNFFIYKKDPSFFKRVVKPYLINKKEKTFMDYWLIDSGLDEYLEPHRFNELNTLEQIILGERLPSAAASIAQHISDIADNQRINKVLFNNRFEAAIKGSALDTEDVYDIRKAQEEAEMKKEQMFMEMNKMVATGEQEYDDSDGEYYSEALALPSPAPMLAMAPPPPPAVSAPMMLARSAVAKPAMEMAVMKKKAPVKRKVADDVRKRKEQQDKQFFKPVETTQEYAETNYWKIRNTESTTRLVTVNAFWKDYANRDVKKDFISGNFIYATNTFTEMMFALAVLDMPLNQSGGHDIEFKDGSMVLTAKTNCVIFHKDITEASMDGQPIMVMQNFFDPADRFITEKGEQIEKHVKDEFLRHKAYSCGVVVTNVSSARQRVEVLLQVPVGAIPISKSLFTKSVFVDLQPYTTQRLEYSFYWPAAGVYDHFPAQVCKDEKVIASALPTRLNVVNAFTKHDKESWEFTSQMGTEEDVLNYLRKHNVMAIDLERIAWRMSNKDFFAKVVSILNSRHVFVPTLWSYALKHKDLTIAAQYLQYREKDLAKLVGPYFQAPFVNTDPVKLKQIEHLEYWPLVNARAHQLGEERVILNDKFKKQYEKLLSNLKFKAELNDEDLLALTYYLLLQDRIDEAIKLFSRIKSLSPSTESVVKQSKSKKAKAESKDKKKKSKKSEEDEGKESQETAIVEGEPLQLQYDYLAVYLDFFNEEPKLARKLIALYEGYPVPRWNKLFAAARQQLKELDEGLRGSEVVDEDDRDQKTAKLASQNPTIDFTITGDKINLAYTALTSVTVRYYRMDIELLFSNSPFVQQNIGNFAYIMPNYEEIINLKPDTTSTEFDIPEEFRNQNIMIDISSGPVSAIKPHFAHSMIVSVMENYGQLRVCARDTGKPIPKAYCKVYARHTSGSVQFYKDGYTDLRGGFDYTSLSTPDITTTERFAILIMSEKHGTRIVEAKPPKQ